MIKILARNSNITNTKEKSTPQQKHRKKQKNFTIKMRSTSKWCNHQVELKILLNFQAMNNARF